MFLNRIEIDSEQKYEPDYSILINLESENFLHLVKHASQSCQSILEEISERNFRQIVHDLIESKYSVFNRRILKITQNQSTITIDTKSKRNQSSLNESLSPAKSKMKNNLSFRSNLDFGDTFKVTATYVMEFERTVESGIIGKNRIR